MFVVLQLSLNVDGLLVLMCLTMVLLLERLTIAAG